VTGVTNMMSEEQVTDLYSTLRGDESYGPVVMRRYRGTAMSVPLSFRIKAIIEHVASARAVTYRDIVGPRRKQRLSLARHIAFYVAREITGASYPALARCFGRDHSTIIHGYNAIEHRMMEFSEFRFMIEKLTADASLR
jgi:chromosomal replication initiation ATPase DnaA